MPREFVVALALALACAAPARAAPSYPIDVRPDGASRGTIALIHAGSWSGPNPDRVQGMRDDAERFAALGWRAVVLEYGAGKGGYLDVRAAVRALAPRHTPFCLYGESAGGHLAVLAAERSPEAPRIACVIAVSAPLDLPTWSSRALAQPYFGNDPRWNPAHTATRLRAPTLLIGAEDDQVAPPQQNGAFIHAFAARPHTSVRRLTLRPGSVAQVHGSASPAEARRAERAQTHLLRAVESS